MVARMINQCSIDSESLSTFRNLVRVNVRNMNEHRRYVIDSKSTQILHHIGTPNRLWFLPLRIVGMNPSLLQFHWCKKSDQPKSGKPPHPSTPGFVLASFEAYYFIDLEVT
jgi:hypothetical protein